MALHVMDEANHCLGCKVPRCQQGCPIHTNIPEVIRLLKDNKLDEAGRMLFENNPKQQKSMNIIHCVHRQKRKIIKPTS